MDPSNHSISRNNTCTNGITKHCITSGDNVARNHTQSNQGAGGYNNEQQSDGDNEAENVTLVDGGEDAVTSGDDYLSYDSRNGARTTSPTYQTNMSNSMYNLAPPMHRAPLPQQTDPYGGMYVNSMQPPSHPPHVFHTQQQSFQQQSPPPVTQRISNYVSDIIDLLCEFPKEGVRLEDVAALFAAKYRRRMYPHRAGQLVKTHPDLFHTTVAATPTFYGVPETKLVLYNWAPSDIPDASVPYRAQYYSSTLQHDIGAALLEFLKQRTEGVPLYQLHEEFCLATGNVLPTARLRIKGVVAKLRDIQLDPLDKLFSQFAPSPAVRNVPFNSGATSSTLTCSSPGEGQYIYQTSAAEYLPIVRDPKILANIRSLLEAAGGELALCDLRLAYKQRYSNQDLNLPCPIIRYLEEDPYIGIVMRNNSHAVAYLRSYTEVQQFIANSEASKGTESASSNQPDGTAGASTVKPSVSYASVCKGTSPDSGQRVTSQEIPQYLCYVCNKTLRDPVTFAGCYHTICQKCAFSQFLTNEQPYILCGLGCGCSMTRSQASQINVALQQQLKQHAPSTQEAPPSAAPSVPPSESADMCSSPGCKQVGVVLCSGCNCLWCSHHNSVIHSLLPSNVLVNHHRTTPAPPQTPTPSLPSVQQSATCTIHTSEKRTFCCTTCPDLPLICSHCLLIGAHKGHSCLSFEDAKPHFDEMLGKDSAELNTKLREFKDFRSKILKVKNDLMYNEVKQCSTVSSKVSALHKLLSAKEEELLGFVHTVFQKKTKSLDNQIKQVSSWASTVTSGLEACNNAENYTQQDSGNFMWQATEAMKAASTVRCAPRLEVGASNDFSYSLSSTLPIEQTVQQLQFFDTAAPSQPTSQITASSTSTCTAASNAPCAASILRTPFDMQFRGWDEAQQSFFSFGFPAMPSLNNIVEKQQTIPQNNSNAASTGSSSAAAPSSTPSPSPFTININPPQPTTMTIKSITRVSPRTTVSAKPAPTSASSSNVAPAKPAQAETPDTKNAPTSKSTSNKQKSPDQQVKSDSATPAPLPPGEVIWKGIVQSEQGPFSCIGCALRTSEKSNSNSNTVELPKELRVDTLSPLASLPPDTISANSMFIELTCDVCTASFSAFLAHLVTKGVVAHTSHPGTMLLAIRTTEALSHTNAAACVKKAMCLPPTAGSATEASGGQLHLVMLVGATASASQPPPPTAAPVDQDKQTTTATNNNASTE
ncbi:hypothetical protein Pelo_4127 [Pelomyxa schiedti]|nr:hypothetical protein Pelo_4127 [Pelomyxa schiedti]